MSRRLVTADDIKAAVAAGRFLVPRGAIITPLAREQAASLGVELVVGSALEGDAEPAAASEAITQQAQGIVAKLLAGNTPAATPPVKLCRAEEAVTEPFPYPGPKPDQQVRTTDVVTSADGSPMAAGYMTLTAGEFPWTFSYDEVQIVLEGELHLGTPDGVRVGKPGDVLFVPKGSKITFGTPSWARFVYVTFPADWEQGL